MQRIEEKNRKKKQNNRRKHEWNAYEIENKILKNNVSFIIQFFMPIYEIKGIL